MPLNAHDAAMLICHGIYKTGISIRNTGPVGDAMDFLMGRCKRLQHRNVQLYLKFTDGEYFPLQNEENLCMAVEMVVRYYIAGLDTRDDPPWMRDMDAAWEEAEEIVSDDESELSDVSYTDEYEEYF
jgi:hypothetical protein